MRTEPLPTSLFPYLLSDRFRFSPPRAQRLFSVLALRPIPISPRAPNVSFSVLALRPNSGIFSPARPTSLFRTRSPTDSDFSPRANAAHIPPSPRDFPSSLQPHRGHSRRNFRSRARSAPRRGVTTPTPPSPAPLSRILDTGWATVAWAPYYPVNGVTTTVFSSLRQLFLGKGVLLRHH